MQAWNNLSPRARRTAMWVAGGAVLVALMTLLPDSKKENPVEKRRRNLSESVLSERNTREVSIDAMATRLRDSETELEKVKRELAQMKGRSGMIAPDEVSRKFQDMQNQIGDLTKQLEQNQVAAEEAFAAAAKAHEEKKGGKATESRQTPHAAKEPQGQHLVEGNAKVAEAASPPLPDPKRPETVYSGGSPVISSRQEQKQDTKRTGTEIRTISADGEVDEKKRAKDKDDQKAKKESATAFFLPAGAIIGGVFMTGLDAPTGVHSSKNPFPALVRIKHEAILPNKFRADIRECFVLLGGYGDLSSERALLRGETLSCVRKDGHILEAQLPAYAVGEDGKAGVRGRLVSKQGQMIANATIAGLVEGFSKAFDTKRVTTILSTSDGSTDYVSNLNPSALQSAGVSGIGSALEKIAEFWLKMAGETLPVIEVDAGRRVDLIVSKGIAVKFMDPEQVRQQQIQAAAAANARLNSNAIGALGASQQNGWFGYGQELTRTKTPR